jgi:RNA polymerase sigma factor (TIGR02999 family)
MDDQEDVTRCLAEIRAGNEKAAQRLIPIVYRELRRLAAGIMKNERPDHTLQATAVVHEAFVRMLEARSLDIKDRAHFFAIAASAMRRVLVDHARGRLADKRGGAGQQRIELDDKLALTAGQSEEVLALHEALTQLEQLDPRQARIVEMHYFAGNPVGEIADVLDIGERTVKRELQTARLFLKRQLNARGLSLP